MAGAELLFSSDGLPPSFWGLSKAQFTEIVAEVRAALAAGAIKNYTPPHTPPYPEALFSDPAKGPNMHQVNQGYIKPRTERCVVTTAEGAAVGMPGLSLALLRNWEAAGLRCELFASHAWDEPFFEFAATLLEAWPDDCGGAYICSFSNPQHAGPLSAAIPRQSIEGSPFFRILHDRELKEVLVVANSRVGVHERLWCVLEAHVASRRSRSVHVRVAGPAHFLLTGRTKSEFHEQCDGALLEAQAVEEEEVAARQACDAAGDVHEQWRQVLDLRRRVNAAKQRIHEAKLGILSKDNLELVDISRGTCTMDADKTMIRSYVREDRKQIEAFVANLIRDKVRQAKLPMAKAELSTDEGSRQRLQRLAIALQKQRGAMAGSELLQGEAGLPASYWGISRAQFADFVRLVRAAHASGEIANSVPAGFPPYPQHVFDDPTRGPSKYQVASQVLGPLTVRSTVVTPEGERVELPALSYSLTRNWETAGALCQIYVSHSFAGAFFEFAERVLQEWRDESKAAFIDIVCLPAFYFPSFHQELLSRLPRAFRDESHRHHSSTPFFRILNALSISELLVVAQLPHGHRDQGGTLTRMWVVAEIFEVSLMGGIRVRLLGSPQELLCGDYAIGDETPKERLRGLFERVLDEQATWDEDLFHIEDLACTIPADVVMMRQYLRGREGQLIHTVARLIRDAVRLERDSMG